MDTSGINRFYLLNAAQSFFDTYHIPIQIDKIKFFWTDRILNVPIDMPVYIRNGFDLDYPVTIYLDDPSIDIPANTFKMTQNMSIPELSVDTTLEYARKLYPDFTITQLQYLIWISGYQGYSTPTSFWVSRASNIVELQKICLCHQHKKDSPILKDITN